MAEVRPHRHRGRIAAVAIPTGELGGLTEVLPAGPAEDTGPAGPGQPGHPNPVTDFPVVDPRSHLGHRPHHLMTRNDGKAARVQVPLHELKVGAAHTAGGDRHPHLPGTE